ncbi:MAG: hypothetical protein ACM3JH_15120 [Acidithiobacillales bacterium]
MKTRLLARVLDLLEGRGARPALIGGMALAAYGVGRATQDFDILVLDTSLLAEESWAALRESGAAVDVRRGDALDPLAGVIRVSKSGEAAVDVIVGKRSWQVEILDRRQTLRLQDLALPVVEAADLVLLKLDAGGPQDHLDVRLLLHGPAGAALRTEVERRLASLPAPLRDAWLTLEK